MPDFEAILGKVSTCQPNEKVSYNRTYQKHTDCGGYGYKVVCCYDDKHSKPIGLYRGENAAHKFLKRMLKEVKWCKKMKYEHFNKDMILIKDDEQNFKNADKCYVCNKNYSKKDIHVRDHCHITGKYRGLADQDYKINYRLTDKIPTIFHNLRGYDSHFIMQNIGKVAKYNQSGAWYAEAVIKM